MAHADRYDDRDPSDYGAEEYTVYRLDPDASGGGTGGGDTGGGNGKGKKK